MAIGILLIMFIVMIVVSILGIVLLFLLKNPRLQNVIFYCLIGWAMLITYVNITALPSNYVGQQVLAGALGAIAVIAVLVKVKKPDQVRSAHLLVAASVILSMLDLLVL